MLLNCHSYFSFCYGTLAVEDLIAVIETKGHREFVLSDINNTSAILETMRLLKDRADLKVIPGIDFRNGISQQYVGIARNNQGFRGLNEHLTRHLHTGIPFEARAPELQDAFIIYPLKTYTGFTLRDNEFIGVGLSEITQLPFSKHKHLADNMVIGQTATFVTKKNFNAHRLLRAIDTNNLLSKLPVEEQGTEDQKYFSRQELLEGFAAYPQIIKNTELILHGCDVRFEFDKLANKNLKSYTASVDEDHRLLREKACEALAYRYPVVTAEITERLEKELALIRQKDFASYFLINWDIVTYARSRNYFYVGRGSGANSMVAYLLRITDVDPIDLDLYFERFINEHRANAPDFDIDFSWTDREDMTRYIFERFGYERTALLGTYSTFQHDAVTRELGKVFGLPPAEIDRLQKFNDPAQTTDPIGKLVLQYSRLIAGFPSHLSIHASGIVISQEPITTYTATALPPKGYPTTQFSMLEAEDIGLFKFDILSQRGLGKIKDAVQLVRENQQVEIDIHDITKFKEDERTKELLRAGQCIGCFYIESPGMRMLLTKLRADDYLRLVAASSIIRPGVSKSGMMNEYIVRYRNPDARSRARNQNPELYDLLHETYGVMVYQEDVIKIAHIFAGLSLADADYLRRGMSWKFKQRNEFHVVRQRFFDNCLAKGFALAVVTDIWVQIESFANFAFSKGHSASYAVESYQALYLKGHYPLEYMVATLNNGGGFYRKELYIHEARMHGAVIHAPSINSSTALSTIKGSHIYLGFGMINDLEEKVIERIITERVLNGPFTDLYQFIRRTRLPIEQIRILIRVGAFHELHENKKKLLWEAHLTVNPAVKNNSAELFDVEPEKYELPDFENSWLDDAFDEIELLGFSLCSPFALLKEPVTNPLCSAELPKLVGKKIEIVGYFVTSKNTMTSNGARMYFGTFLDQQGRWIDTIHFPESARAFPFNGPGCYCISGTVTEEFDFVCVNVAEMHRLPMLNREEDISTRVKNYPAATIK